MAREYVTFRSGKEYFALDIRYVKEIVVVQDITAIPESENYVKGMADFRGSFIPVIDVRMRLKQEPKEYDDHTCMIVVALKGHVVGLAVEEIAQIVELSRDDITPSPRLGHPPTPKGHYVYAIGKIGNGMKLLLNPERLLAEEELAMLEETIEMVKKAETEKETEETEIEKVEQTDKVQTAQMPEPEGTVTADEGEVD